MNMQNFISFELAKLVNKYVILKFQKISKNYTFYVTFLHF